jgi:hypothetical protein
MLPPSAAAHRSSNPEESGEPSRRRRGLEPPPTALLPAGIETRAASPQLPALAFGEGWHNNHHAFPAMAYHGMGSRPDATGMMIRLLERVGLVWDVNRPDDAAVARRQARAMGAPARGR